MLKHNRPCIVVVRLKFRGKRRDFAVPLRSNIAPNVPKDQYFPLPPRPTTKPNHRHGVHYIKMFPIEKKYQQRFRTDGSKYYENLQSILDANTKQIVSECQSYLDRYEAEGKPKYAVDIDRIIELMETHGVIVNLKLGHKSVKKGASCYYLIDCDSSHPFVSITL